MREKIQRLRVIQDRIQRTPKPDRNIAFFHEVFRVIRSELAPLGHVTDQFLIMLETIDRDFDSGYKTGTIDSLRLMVNATIEHLRRQSAPRVFLCHASEDKEKIDWIERVMREEGLDPWYDKEKLEVGDPWEDEIFRAIEQSDFFAVFLSNVSVSKRGFINQEIRTAAHEYKNRPFGSRYFFPVRLEKCTIPRIKVDESTLLSDFQWVDVGLGDAAGLSRLIRGIWNAWVKTKEIAEIEPIKQTGGDV